MTAPTATAPCNGPRPDVPFEIPAAPPPPTFRWRRVLRLLGELRDPDKKVDAGLVLFDALGGVGGERTFQRFAKCPEGRALLRTRPDLAVLLGDRSFLAALPEGSLGRAYMAFADENGFTAESLVEQNRSVQRERPVLDPSRDWFWERFTLSHDLWHVLTDCPTTEAGEATLLAFTSAQAPQRGYWFLLSLISLGVGLDLHGHARHLRAWRAGKRAESLIPARWEELLAWPLEDVRRCFGVPELMQ